MIRGRGKTGSGPDPKVPADPALLELDLVAWAGARVAAGGRKDALLGRVETLHLSLDGKSLEARVRGNRPLPYQVAAETNGDGSVAASCTCSREASGPCRHAVAAVEALRFPLPPLPGPGELPPRRRGPGRAGRGRGRIVRHATPAAGFVIFGGVERTRTRAERLHLVRQEELTMRRNRARRERAEVHPLADAEGPQRFEVVGRKIEPAACVTAHGPAAAYWTCDCSDFADNELETCKHVERVRRRRGRPEPPPEHAGRAELWIQPREWIDRPPEILREIRIGLPGGQAPAELARYFDADGWLEHAPAGDAPSRWAARAVDTVRSIARRRGWPVWIAPDVQASVDAAAATESREAQLADAVSDGSLWQEIDSNLGFDLHPYQRSGARFLARRGRAFLADDMGLGKTVQAIVAALLLRRAAGARKAMVVCPASLKHQWKREIEKACGERAIVVDGVRRRRLADYACWDEGFLIVNYELVLRDLDAIRQAEADLVVLDEAQRIKNWETKTARAVKRLSSPYAFVLTGTPLENRLLELHSLVEYLHPRALGPRWRLIPFHAVTDAGGRVIAYEGLDVLRRRLSGFFLRRERRTVLSQLPDRTDNTFWTGMTPAQRRPYRRHAATAAALLSQNRPLQPPEVRAMLRALTSMRILCNAAAQYDWEAFRPRLDDPTAPDLAELKGLGSPKLREFVRVLEDLLDGSEGKVVVFSQWLRMLQLAHFAVREPLEQRDLRAATFHGSLNARERSELLEAFDTDPEFRVLFSTDAGGLGLNLQKAASIVVNLEVPWNPAVLEQRIGRVHRLGQRRSVQVLHFVTRGAIEERVRMVVEGKRALFEGLLDADADQVVVDASSRPSFLARVRRLIDDQDSAKSRGSD